MGNRSQFGSIKTRPPRPGFYCVFHWDGRRYEKYGGPTRAITAKKLSRVHAALADGAPVARVLSLVFGSATGTQFTFRQAAALYLEHSVGRKTPSTINSDVYRLKTICLTRWADSPLGRITPHDISAWTDARLKAGVSGATINRDLALISALYGWAVDQGHVDTNPARRVRRHSERHRPCPTYLQAAEARALLAACEPRMRTIVFVGLHTSLRRGAILGLRWRDVDFDRNLISVRPAIDKRGRERVFPMADTLAAFLREIRSERPTVHPDDRIACKPNGGAISESWVSHRFKAVVRGVEDIPAETRERLTFHGLRHTAASLMLQAGVPLAQTSKVLGHANIGVTMRYAHFSKESDRDAVGRLADMLRPPATDEGLNASANQEEE